VVLSTVALGPITLGCNEVDGQHVISVPAPKRQLGQEHLLDFSLRSLGTVTCRATFNLNGLQFLLPFCSLVGKALFGGGF
ncbi:MAG: hypothetical protein WCO84_08070, partial [bacterium]